MSARSFPGYGHRAAQQDAGDQRFVRYAFLFRALLQPGQVVLVSSSSFLNGTTQAYPAIRTRKIC
jgi:hypothetical protein